MFLAFWSVKGGVGTTVVAASVALAARGATAPPPLLVDLAGDQPLCLGASVPADGGVAAWSRVGSATRPDSLTRLIVPIGGPGERRLDLLPRGCGPLAAGRLGLLGQLLRSERRTVIVDAGTQTSSDHLVALGALLDHAHRSILVTRACVLGLRRAASAPRRYDGVALVQDRPARLRSADVAAVLDRPVLAEIDLHPATARAVDAGLLAARLPRGLLGAVTPLLTDPRGHPATSSVPSMSSVPSDGRRDRAASAPPAVPVGSGEPSR